MASATQWAWIWASSKRWWRTGKPGVRPWGHKESDMTKQLNNNNFLPKVARPWSSFWSEFWFCVPPSCSISCIRIRSLGTQKCHLDVIWGLSDLWNVWELFHTPNPRLKGMLLPPQDFWEFLGAHNLRWHSGKESACQCRRLKRWGLNPWVRKIP